MTFDFLSNLTQGDNKHLDTEMIHFMLRYYNLRVGQIQTIHQNIDKHIELVLKLRVERDLSKVTVLEKFYLASVNGFSLPYKNLHLAQKAIPELETKAMSSFIGMR